MAPILDHFREQRKGGRGPPPLVGQPSSGAGPEPEWVKGVFSVLPDPEAGENIIKDGEPSGAQVLNPDNPPPDGIENSPPGTGGPTFDEGPRPRDGDVPPPTEGQAAPPADGAPPPEAP